MTQVTGPLFDEAGNLLANTTCLVQAQGALVGQDGGGRAKRGVEVTTSGAGVFDAEIKPGAHILTVWVQAEGAATVTTQRVGKLTVLDQANQSLQSALDSDVGDITPSVLQQSLDAADLSQAWAESPTPPDPDDATSKSSKTWAGEAEGFRDEAEAAADSINQQTVDTVAGIAGNVTTVAGISADVTAVAADEADIGIVAADIADVSTVAGISSDVTAVAADAADIGIVATDIADVSAVAGISSDVTTVSGISADVTTVAADGTDIGVVAGISADVTTVAADVTDIGIVATDITDVSTVAGIAANVTTVAGISADVTTVAGISADVTTAAANVTDITNFADVYIGPSATDPTLRNDGSALQDGDLYFDTTNDVMKVFDGSGFVAAFASLSGALLATNNLSDLTDASVARTNLALGATDSPSFAGLTATTADINGGTIDGTVIGGSTPAAISGTTGTFTSADITGGTIDGTVIGGSNPSAGAFTSLTLDGVPVIADLASQAQAEAGTDNETLMTPLRTAQAIEELAGGGNPAGTIIFYAANTAPEGFLKANGAAISRTTFAELFAAIGTTFGAGDGSTTFTLPDLRGEFPRGFDDGRGVDSGRAFGSAQLDSVQRFSGALTNILTQGGFQTDGILQQSTPYGSPIWRGSVNVNRATTLTINSDFATSDLRTSNQTRARNIALLACIKF